MRRLGDRSRDGAGPPRQPPQAPWLLRQPYGVSSEFLINGDDAASSLR